MTTTNYDPKFVNASLGDIILDGYMTGDFLTVSYDEDAFTVTPGGVGDTVWVRSHNQIATVVVTVLESSPVNDRLSELHRRDKLFGDGERPFLLERVGGSTVVQGESARIIKVADAGYGTDMPSRAWTIKIANADVFLGGAGS